MAESAAAPGNKLVRFRGRAQKEFTRSEGDNVMSDAGHKKVPKFAKAPTRSGKMAVPRNVRGRGLISPKAMKAMGAAQAAAAKPPKGQHDPTKASHAEPGMAPHGKPQAAAAKPPKGQRKPRMAKPAIGTQVAQEAPGDIV